MLEVEPTGQRGRMATGSSRNGKDASKAFAMWLHHSPTTTGTYRFAARCLVVECVLA